MSKRYVVSILVLLVWFAVPASGVPASGNEAETVLDWPQWRGPSRDAVSRETGLVDQWGEKGPDVVWRVAAGEGFSSVSVSGGRLYTLWDERGKQFLFCLDAATGKELWRRELGPAFQNHYGNGPRSTPLVDDGIVYTIGTAGLLLAANQRTGETLWQRDLVADFHSDLPSYGYSSSPIAVDGRLVIEAGGKTNAFVALDPKTGETIWTSESDQPAYSSPIHITVDGVSQVLFWSAHGLHSVASENGELLWKFPWETFCPVSGDPLNTGTPILVAPDRIFLSSGSGAAVIRVTRAKGQFQVQELWKSEQMRNDVNSALFLQGQIYGFDRGTLKSLDAETGEVRWKVRGFQRGSLIAADGKLIVLGEAGNLALLDADPGKYVEKSNTPLLQGRNWTAPTLAGGRLYLRNNDEIVCVELRKR